MAAHKVPAGRTLAAVTLEYDEGRRRKLYRCTAGYLTIGVGWNIEANGLPDHIIDALLQYGQQVAARDLDRLLDGTWRTADPIRQAALINWSFQLGYDRMAKFVRTLPMLRQQRWADAARALRLSKWAKSDSPARAARVIHMIQHGTLPHDYPTHVHAVARTVEAAVGVEA
jgi:lysozyme